MAYVRITEGGADYPFDLTRLRQMYPGVSFPAVPADAALLDFGIYPVTGSPRPDAAPGERVEEIAPAFIAGTWTQQWAVRAITAAEFEEARAAARDRVREQFAAVTRAGFAYDFGVAIGTRRLDMRNADDKGNWTLLLLKCQGMIAAGAGAATVQIRAQDNSTFEVSAADAATAMQAMLGWGGDIYTRKWALDDEIAGASSSDELAAIDVAAGWPG